MEGERPLFIPSTLEPIALRLSPPRTCRVILAPDGTIIAILAGQPNDEAWPTVTENAQQALDDMRRDFRFAHSDFSHRRGDYWSVTTGYTYGGGQPVSVPL